jgi:hypothetical protein
MYAAIKNLRRLPLLLLVRLGWAGPVAWLCHFFVTSLERDGATGPVVLALNPGRFRGDLEVLAEEQGVRIRAMSFAWQCFLYTCFYKEADSCILDKDEPRIATAQIAYRAFLRKFLPRLFATLGVEAVIGAATHYRQDYDIATVSHELNIPTLILQREGNLGSLAVQRQFSDRCKQVGRFHGTKLMVHNAVQKNILLDTGFATPDQVTVGGNIRMDRFVRAIRAGQFEGKNSAGRVTLFSFGPGTGNYKAAPPNWPINPEKYLLEFCRDTHCVAAKFARDHPDVEVVIKAKWGGGWIANIEALLEGQGLHPGEIPNLLIVGDGDAQKMMARSDVVIGFASTTLVESAAMGRATILPYFHEISSERMADFVFYRDDFDCFDLARSPEELEHLIETRLSDFTPTPELNNRRIELFEKYVSHWDASATEKCVAKLTAMIEGRENSG